MNFRWIDDNPQREEGARNLGEALNVETVFIDVSTADSETRLSNLLESEEPDLIIIDHNLEDIESGVFKKGSTVATYIRERWFDCPIISVSSNIVEIDSQQRALYVDLFPFERISDFYPNILSIATSFKTLKNKKPTNTDEFLDMLGTPEDDRINLTNVLPMTLKHNFTNKSLLVEIAQWIKFVLLKRPGFLMDRTWVATLVGIKPESFYKVEAQFEGAKYTSYFSNDNEERWWKSEVLVKIYELVEAGTYPWEKGRFLPGIVEQDFSVCHASGEPFPETVAFIDNAADAPQVPIKIKYSHLHPDYESLLNFEDIRMMTPAQ
jgi:CheY-like chemotaxis protein